MDFTTLEEIQDYFSGDEFATKCLGAQIDSYDFDTGETQVSMTLDERHHNAQGFVMGGVFFSLADFALAICTNVNQPASASTNASIANMCRAKGDRLIAIARPDKLGHSLGFVTVDIFDELGTHVARMTATVMRTQR